MSDQKPVQKLLNSEMDRRQFLGFLGAASLAVIGASSLVRGLQGVVNGRTSQNGYGSSAYGGRNSEDQSH
jgi:hypothetical protein